MNEDPLLTATEVSALLTELRGHRVARTTWTAYVSRGEPKRCPAPKPLPENSIYHGRISTKRWRKSTIINWNEIVTSIAKKG